MKVGTCGLNSAEGFDADRIEAFSKDADKRDDPVLGPTYRVRILETGMEGLRKLKRTTRISHQGSRPEAQQDAQQLALEDKKETSTNSSDSSSSSTSSSSRKHKKSKKHSKKHKKSKKSKKHCKKDGHGRERPTPEESWLRSRLLVLLSVLQRLAASYAAAPPLPNPVIHCIGQLW